MFYWLGDWSYLIIVPGIIIALIAQIKVKSAYSKYREVRSASGITGEQTARHILNLNGITNVRIERVNGRMSDHFDPREGVIRLSDEVYDGSSIAAVSIAAHECGHAIQYSENYAPLSVRNFLLPVANIGTTLAFPLVIIGLFFEAMPFLADIGIILFGFALLFQVLTLPVEFNASSRAMDAIKCEGFLSMEESRGARKMLSAAAMTYVAALLVTLLQFFRLVYIANSRNR